MGVTHVDLKVSNINNRRKKASGEFLVDTGALYTLLPKGMVDSLEIKPNREQKFSLADGRIVKRKLGSALVQVNGTTEATTVILGEKGDSALLGTVTLEQMGLVVDPFKREIRQMKLMNI